MSPSRNRGPYKRRMMQDFAKRAHVRQADIDEFSDDLERRTGSRSAVDLVLKRKVQLKDSPVEEIEF